MKKTVLMIILGILFLFLVPVYASPDDYHPQGSDCGQYHGAFEYYSHGFIQDLIPTPPRGTDGTTGERNSAKGCQQHFAPSDLESNSSDKPVPKVTGDIWMSDPSQQIDFNAFDYGDSSVDKGTVEYWNYDYPGPLHYTANVLCANVNTSTKESWFMFQIPDGWPGLTGLYVVSYVKDVGTPGTNGDLYGHTATSDLSTAQSWCNNGTAPVSMYPIASGNLVVHN